MEVINHDTGDQEDLIVQLTGLADSAAATVGFIGWKHFIIVVNTVWFQAG